MREVPGLRRVWAARAVRGAAAAGGGGGASGVHVGGVGDMVPQAVASVSAPRSPDTVDRPGIILPLVETRTLSL